MQKSVDHNKLGKHKKCSAVKQISTSRLTSELGVIIVTGNLRVSA